MKRSATKTNTVRKLIDFGDVEHEYDEVPEEESNEIHEEQLLQSTNNNNNNNNNNKNNKINREEKFLSPELPPPKPKSLKNSTATQTNTKLTKTSKSKSKIPRSPSHASLINNNNINSSSTSANCLQQAATSTSTAAVLLPPQTPPLPLSYQQRSKLMNGGIPKTSTSAALVNNNNNNSNNAHNASSLRSNNNFMGSGVNLNNNNNNNVEPTLRGGGVGMNGAGNHRGSLNMASARRPQIQVSSPMPTSPGGFGSPTDSPGKGFQYLTVVVRKDENGYGMKVSGDNPVFVESVKPGGAAQVAGLIAGDMILKVNGQEVRSEKHPTVVSLIKASTNVELAVKRSQKLSRPSSVGIVPSTPILSGRDRTASITGPQPVDSIKRREMETYKIQTLQKMLEQEKLNLERLKGETNNPSYKLSEANIKRLREQLRQVGAEALGQTPPNLSHMSKHRRVVSSPDNMHPRHPDRLNKTTSGSWDLAEKDGEETPPGTPPPPYLTMLGSTDDAADSSGAGGAIFIDSHHFTPLASSPLTPLAQQPTNAHSMRATHIHAAQTSSTQKEIISMEDEDASDQECPYIDENGPFNNLQRLLEAEHAAFLAVFLNYVLSNSEPAPLLFYLITGLYKEGTAKDMRKWAYEIHSTFLVPRAPLVWYRQDESLAREVDNVLQTEFDKVDLLRKVFWKSRKCARLIITEQLREFQQKRTAGLGTIYGPTDAQLAEAKGDKQREQHIFEDTLLRKLQILIDDYEKDHPIEDPTKLALCSALSTVIHRIFITRSHPNSIVDKVHHFVSREKSFKSRIMGKNRKMAVRGHPLVLRQYYEVTHCNHCQTIIWGVSPQGYHCTDCKLNIHRPCSKVLDENCPGPLPQAKRKDNNDNKISKIMGKIRTRTSNDFISAEAAAEANERLHSASIVRQPSDRRPDAASSRTNSSSTSAGAHNNNNNDLQNSFHESRDGVSSFDGSFAAGGGTSSATGGVSGVNTAGATLDNDYSGSGGIGAGIMGTDANSMDADGKDARRERLHQQHLQNKSAPVSVNRSESYKERLSNKRNRSRRKTSDPSLTSRPNEEQSDLGLSNSNYTASSNSSLSSGGGSESPSTSMEQVANAATNVPHPHHHHHHQHYHHHHHGHSNSMHGHHTGAQHAHQHSHQDSFHSSSGGSTSFWGGSISGGTSANQLTRQWNFESDEEDDLHEADWSSMVAADLLSALTDAEKKRQEIINEIYQTERSHVRTLKLLERLFFCPLQESGVLSMDHLMLLFPPALMTLRELHSAFEQKLKQRRLEDNHVVQHVGDLLAHMFDGQSGDELREFAAQFCARQQIALEALKEKRRKDEQLQKLLSKAESHKACRRLQLKDLLPTVLQRLTKYPLLFENLYKVTVRVLPENTSEAEAIQRALESSKKILVDVNQAVKTAEDAHKLQNIQRKLDKSTFDKDEFKNLDLTQYRLIFDGNLTLKKSPSIQLHGLLFEDMILLLTKQDDKYSLKYLQQHTTARNNEVNSKPVSPIMNIMDTIARQDAADKNSFFLIKTKTSQMLELRAPSSSESKTWFKHITDAAEQYKRSKHATTETVDDPTIVTIPHSSTKESLELTSERPAALAATATVTITPLAPMIPQPTVTAVATTYITPSHNNNQHNHHHNNNHNHNGSNDSLGGVQLRNNGRRESTPIYSMPPPSQHAAVAGGGSPLPQKSMRHSHNELTPGSSNNLSINSGSANSLSPVVNRTMSTRSCGAVETPTSNAPSTAGVTLRHTQSARQATAQDAAELSASRRDSNSIVYAHNPNNTRTLLQTAPPLIDPSAVQISITPVHICETPAERLRRLDGNIREGLLEKQRIICDMFRLPVEHFHEIVDIAAMPEAPKDSADIALAAYAQVQSLTELYNEYLQITPAQESAAISAASTNGCAQCHDKQAPPRPLAPYAGGGGSSSSSSSSITPVTVSERTSPSSGVPPPLPPPHKQQPAGQTATPSSMPKLQTPVVSALENAPHIHEDDDGYCEIDELRLPALPASMQATTTPSNTKTKTTAAIAGNSTSSASPPPPLPPPVGSCKATPPPPPPPPPPPATTSTAATITANPTELTKRQSTISADSIPEESAEEITRAMAEDDNERNGNESNEQSPLKVIKNDDKTTEEKSDETKDDELLTDKAENSSLATTETEATTANEKSNGEETSSSDNNEKKELLEQVENTDSTDAKSEITTGDIKEGNKIIKPALVDVDTQTTLSLCPNNVVNANTTTIITIGTNNNNSTAATATYENCNHNSTLNGPIRIQHANNIEPSVPCHALTSIVCALNTHISLLLPTINERDLERERLRKENQRLRELLNAMQRERPRVESKMETPTDITLSNTAATNSTMPTAGTPTTTKANAEDECDGPAVTSNTEAKTEKSTTDKSEDIEKPTTTTATTTTCNSSSSSPATESNNLH